MNETEKQRKENVTASEDVGLVGRDGLLRIVRSTKPKDGEGWVYVSEEKGNKKYIRNVDKRRLMHPIPGLEGLLFGDKESN